MPEDKEFKVIGTRPIRHDGIDKVTGRAAYGADIHFPDMLHGKVLRSPYAHARIKSIDISKASSHPAGRPTQRHHRRPHTRTSGRARAAFPLGQQCGIREGDAGNSPLQRRWKARPNAMGRI